MSKLLIRSGTPDADGCVLSITPESAGWRHIGFQVHRLKGGQAVRGGTGERETCLVVLAGTADIVVDDHRFEGIGHRGSVFDDAAPGAVYGVILIAIMFLMPDGAGGFLWSLWRRIRR